VLVFASYSQPPTSTTHHKRAATKPQNLFFAFLSLIRFASQLNESRNQNKNNEKSQKQVQEISF
jgi:hypothetical protein